MRLRELRVLLGLIKFSTELLRLFPFNYHLFPKYINQSIVLMYYPNIFRFLIKISKRLRIISVLCMQSKFQ